MLKNLMTGALLLCTFVTFPQSPHLIKGIVLAAENHQPLPGATVTLGKSTGGTSTNAEGRFTIEAAAGKNVLSVSFVGRESAEIETRTDTVTILLSLSNKMLDEVVAVAYTNVKRSGYPGAVSTVIADKISNRQTGDISNSLQGLVAGLQTESANGQPGNGSTLLIRGSGSINASSSPLIVVNGAPYDGDINALNPADIASISVLKDATSANLYGSRAANGVILITTKNGKASNTAAIHATINQGWSNRAVRDYDQVNTDQYFQLDTILVERRKELWGEGFSLSDIIRLQKPVVRKPYTDGAGNPIQVTVTTPDGTTKQVPARYHTAIRFPDGTPFAANSPYYLFAIPQSEEQNNPNLYK